MNHPVQIVYVRHPVPGLWGNVKMVANPGSGNHTVSDKSVGAGVASDHRAPWSTPRVIVSDLGDARAQVDFGGDGSTPSYGPYGS